MTIQTNIIIVALRNMGRALGLNKFISSYILGAGYEAQYDTRLSATIITGDCVWDVGANVGYYTRSFSQRVGDKGAVFAFEPSPVNFGRLTAACAELVNVNLVNAGLGLNDDKLYFQQGEDDLGATSHMVEHISLRATLVDIRSGASLILSGHALQPNVIKIDVEGFEYEVLRGIGERLSDMHLRSIGIEVHFGILQSRGMSRIPRQIESLLQHHGFVISWPDNSHILAIRPS